MQNVKSIFRNFSLPLPAFDHLKQFQRRYEQQHQVRLTNSQALALILRQHQAWASEEGGTPCLRD